MKIENNCELKNYTTFKIGGAAKTAYFPENIEEFVEFLGKTDSGVLSRQAHCGMRKNQIKDHFMALGAGSNVLISSFGIDKNVVITKHLDKFNINGRFVEAQAGVDVRLLAREAQKQGLSGMEFMIGVPASVGGAVCMNAGAHNQQVSDIFLSASVFDIEHKKIVELSKDDMNFGYRKSVLSGGKFILLSAKFELKAVEQTKIDDIINRNIEFRKNHQPNLSEPNAGSIFKNPQNDSAGRLLDLCQMKGEKVGGAIVWERHANFIVNFGNASSTDVLKLMLVMKNAVREKYMINLIPEIKFIASGAENGEEELELWSQLIKK